MILIGGGQVITRSDNKPFFADGCVAVEGSRIVEVGETKAMRKKYAHAEWVDVEGKLIMPGFINMHQHIYSALARGMSLKNAKVSKNFDEILENLWWRLDRALGLNAIKYSALTTYMDGIKNGVTTVFDHHASAGHIEGSLFEIAKAAEKLGVRTNLAYEVSDRDGEDKMRAGINENIDFYEFAKTKNDMLGALFGLHASFTLSEDTLKQCVDAGGAEIGFHVHVAEGKGDVADSFLKYEMPVVKRFEKAGILGPKTLAIHCIHIDDAEKEILKQTGTAVIHNPQSNMGNAVGCADVLGMFDKGVLMGLGTDGYTTDMIESMKSAGLIHKHVSGDPSAAWGEPPAMLFKNNAVIAGRYMKGKIGVLEKDAYADLIVVDYDPLTPLDENNINGHIHFGMMGKQVVSTMINGEFVYKDRVILNVDEKEVLAKSREAAEALWEQA